MVATALIAPSVRRHDGNQVAIDHRPLASHQPSTIDNHLTSAIDPEPSAIRHQPSAIGHRQMSEIEALRPAPLAAEPLALDRLAVAIIEPIDSIELSKLTVTPIEVAPLSQDDRPR
jgi:hypothetical protein